jgi:isopenicillin N synthase-like dioxygenase
MHEYPSEHDDDDHNHNHDQTLPSNEFVNAAESGNSHKPGLYIQIRSDRSHRDQHTDDDGDDTIASTTTTSVTELVHVALAPTSLGFQIGETTEIMTLGQLRATPHAVKAPMSSDKTSKTTGRASLAVFLQPMPDQVLPPLPTLTSSPPTDPKTCPSSSNDIGHGGDDAMSQESLRRRWRPTFGEFQQATTEAFN